jgi:hypothetical protein
MFVDVGGHCERPVFRCAWDEGAKAAKIFDTANLYQTVRGAGSRFSPAVCAGGAALIIVVESLRKKRD